MRSRKLLAGMIAVAVLVVAGLVTLAQQRVGPPPSITIEPALPAIGKGTAVKISVSARDRGLGDVVVDVVQTGHAVQVANEHHVPRPFWAFWGPRDERTELAVDVGSQHQDWLQEGDATIQVTAARAGTWLHAPDPAVAAKTLPVRLRPPAVQIASAAVYAAQGGCEAVVYRITGTAVKDGVQSGDWWFPGYPLPGGTQGERFALFAVPYDLGDQAQIRLVAADDVGNVAEVPAVERFFPKPPTSETIEVSDAFLHKVVPAILAMTTEIKDTGDLLKNYLLINDELRRRNAAQLVDLAKQSKPQFLWTEAFLQMPNTKVMSSFADRRTYLHDGQPIDQQDHLGFDLASTRQAEIPAANDGVVVMAHYFGIYGNAVVIDHGYGLMTLYGHLSSIDVKEGQQVHRAQTIGHTGDTGLAGGDHLHFTMLLDGLPVTPVEWWDPHWIRDRLKKKLGGALPFKG
jgi:murein DD-endopeptidase MepM/ murein hydrolase activator NlpD